MTTAAIILQQLGGNRLIAMVGATHLVDHGDGLSFKFGRGLPHRRGLPNYCKITLDPSDTYTVELGRLYRKRGVVEYNQLASFAGVYADMLIQLFEDQTKLTIRL